MNKGNRGNRGEKGAGRARPRTGGKGRGGGGRGSGGRALVLAGDIGGTKTYLGLFDPRDGRPEAVREEGYLNASYAGAGEIISEFLAGGGQVASACLGIACPVEGNRGEMTNLDWVVDGGELAEGLGIPRVTLINDLVATALGVVLLGKDDLAVLQAGEPREGNCAIIAAGTGLGEAILFWDGSRHIPSASEGGHADFAPRDAMQKELLGYIYGLYGHASYERVLSGPGLETIYSFLKERRGAQEPDYLKERFRREGKAAVVADEAVNGTDENCRDALDLFISVYGAEAGNLALKSMPVSGLYVGGGIAPKILKAMKGGAFVRAFRDKGRFDELLSRIPVYVILNDRTALMGAALSAAASIEP